MLYDWQNKTIRLGNGDTIPMCFAFFIDRGCTIKDTEGGRNVLHLVKYDTVSQEVTVVAHNSKTGEIKLYAGGKIRFITTKLPMTIVPGTCEQGTLCPTCNLVRQEIIEKANQGKLILPTHIQHGD